MNTPKLIITRGLPASGKSTWAVRQLQTTPDTYVRLERDLLRDQLLGHRDYSRITSEQENLITSVQRSMAQAALKAGKTVIISDTNLPSKVVREWAKLAASCGAEFEQKIFDEVTLSDLIDRDAGRFYSVGEKVIQDKWNRATKNGKIAPVDVSKELNNSLVIEPYDNPTNLPSAIIVDVDGTLAQMNGRSPYEWHRVGEDTPVEAVIDAVRAAAPYSEIIVMSGRDGSCRSITENWLVQNLGVAFFLHMRAEGDNRKDDLVKYELFNNHVRNKYHVKYILDDRPQVCRMWRKLGLHVFQCGDPEVEF